VDKRQDSSADGDAEAKRTQGKTYNSDDVHGFGPDCKVLGVVSLSHLN
jgi:hypothetical protein